MVDVLVFTHMAYLVVHENEYEYIKYTLVEHKLVLTRPPIGFVECYTNRVDDYRSNVHYSQGSICINVYMYACIYIYIFIHTHTHTHIYI